MARRKTHEEFIKELNTINPNIKVIDKYIHSQTKIKVKCKIDGHEWETVPNNLLNRRGCPKCGGVYQKTHEEFIEEMKNINPNIKVLGKYKTNKTKIKVKCKIDRYEWEITPHGLLQGYGCPKCGKTLKKTHEEFVKELENINPNIEVLGKYKTNQTKIKVKCKIDGHKWEATPGSLLQKHGCPKCNRSKGETTIEKYCKSNYISYSSQYRIEKCRYKKPLPFDFVLFNQNKLIALIEYQGEQHYRAFEFFGGEKGFKYRQKLDKIKRDYCKANNIKLIEIPYWEEDIETFIDEQLNNTGNNIQLSII